MWEHPIFTTEYLAIEKKYMNVRTQLMVFRQDLNQQNHYTTNID